MSCVLSKESHEIIKSLEVARYRQQSPAATTKVQELRATTATYVLNHIHVGKRKRLATQKRNGADRSRAKLDAISLILDK
jgi:hypothetical protein